MNLERSRALSPAGSFARRAAAFARSSFVGTWRCCWRFRIRNCLKASWSEGPVSRSASSWPLAAIRGAMGGGLGSLRASPTGSGGGVQLQRCAALACEVLGVMASDALSDGCPGALRGGGTLRAAAALSLCSGD